MLKVRLMGTKNDIAWFQKILQRHPKIEVMELSELYSNKGTSKYYTIQWFWEYRIIFNLPPASALIAGKSTDRS